MTLTVKAQENLSQRKYTLSLLTRDKRSPRCNSSINELDSNPFSIADPNMINVFKQAHSDDDYTMKN